MSREHAFDESAYTFMTFLYAAAVHLVIAKAYEVEGLNRASDLCLLCLIAFLFSDWASRARLPRLLPESPSGYLFVAKVSLEILCVFFLVSSFLLLIGHIASAGESAAGYAPSTYAFGCFLLATAAWDFLMVYIMKDLDVPPLLRAVWITGAAIDMNQARKAYLGKFDAWKKKRDEQVATARELTRAKIEKDKEHPGRHHIAGIRHEIRHYLDLHLFEGGIAAVAQFVGHHILHANVIAGLALILDARWMHRPVVDGLFHSARPVYDLAVIGPNWAVGIIGVMLAAGAWFGPGRRLVRLVALAAALSLLFYLRGGPVATPWLKLAAIVAAVSLVATFCYAWRGTRWSKLGNRLGSWAIVLPMLALYLVLPSGLLVALLAAQQVCVNAFLQLGVSISRTASDPDEPAEPTSDEVAIAP